MACLRTAWAVALISGLAACAQTPPAQRVQPAASAPSIQRVASQVSVRGQGGQLPRAARETLLRQLGEQGGTTLVQRHLSAMSRFGSVELLAGNQAQLLVDGPATFGSMFAAIEQARSTILLESYIIDDAATAQRLAQLLARKREQGVGVAVLYDAVGSIGTPAAYFDDLRSHGVAVCAFNPLKPVPGQTASDITQRDHRKILVVDRDVAFTGGINISAVYSSGSFRRRPAAGADASTGWRDTQIRLRGPAASALDDLVRQTWSAQGCTDTLAAAAPRPPGGTAAGTQVLRIVAASPGDAVNRIYELLLTAIDASQRSVLLTMAYFAPGNDMLDALCEAAERGVDVRLILPSLSDFSPVLVAGRSYYDRLLAAGVKVYELQGAVLHAKTAVIDGVVSTVGTSNMDWRSFGSNQEVNAVVIGEDFGDTLTELFRRDQAASQAIDLVQWRQRSVWQRTKEAVARLLERWW